MAARRWGFISPSSTVSTVALMAPISVRPSWLTESIIPGYTSIPAASITAAPAGAVTSSPISTIRPSRIRMDPDSMGSAPSASVWIRAF